MREQWELFKESLSEDKVMTKREWLLTIAVFALAGVVFGMMLSPRKNTTIGSHNGNNCGNNTGRTEQDEERCIVTEDAVSES